MSSSTEPRITCTILVIIYICGKSVPCCERINYDAVFYHYYYFLLASDKRIDCTK